MKSFKLPLESLIQQLESEGFEIDAATYYRLQKAIEALGKQYFTQPEKLPQILAPIVAQSEEEQLKFDKVFAAYYQEVSQTDIELKEEVFYEENTAEEEEMEEEDLDAVYQQAARKRRVWVYPIGAVLVLCLIIWFTKSKTTEAEVNSITFADDPITQPEEEESVDFEVENKDDIRGIQALAYIRSNTNQPEVGKKVIFRSKYQAYNYAYTWSINGKPLDEHGPKVEVEFDDPGLHAISLTIEDGLTDSPNNSGNKSDVLHYQVRAAGSIPAMTAAELKQKHLEQKQFLVKFLVFALYLLLVVGVELYMRWYRFSFYQSAFRHKFIQEKDASYRLPTDARGHDIAPESDFYSLARALKQPKASHREVLDIDATLYETVRAGGYPALQYAPLTQEAEYIILIDQSATVQVQAGLFMELMRMLRKEGVKLHIFTYNGDPRTCYVDGSKLEIAFSSIAQKYGDHRLIMFGKGSYLAASHDQGLAEWVETSFNNFEQRILLTPEPQALWGRREQELARIFLLLPFDANSQQKLAEAMLDPEHAHFDDLREKVFAQISTTISLDQYDFDNTEEVEDYLGEALFEWLGAAMLYPQPDWQIMIEVGEALEGSTQTGDILLKDKKGENLITVENLSKLASLPFIHAAEWPADLRRDMLKNMSKSTAEHASTAIQQALEVADLQPDSPAWKQREAYRILQAAQADPEDAMLQKQLRFLWKNQLLDEAQQEKVGEQLDLTVGEKLHANTIGKVGRKQWRRLALVLMLAIPAVFGGYSVNQVNQHSNDKLFERYFDTKIVASQTSTTGPYADLIAGFLALDLHDIPQAITHFEQLHKQPTNISQIGAWYTALAYVKGNTAFAAKTYLQGLAHDPQALFHEEAKALLSDLNSIWHRPWEE